MADLTRIAWIIRRTGSRFQPREFIDLFLDAAGPGGTLVIPTFNFDLRSGESYDIRRTPTISGALGQAALEHPAFGRTRQPLHSFAVAGALKDEFMALDDPGSFSARSAFALLHGHEFKLLAIDMPLEPAFTYVHHVEESLRVPYRRWREIRLDHTDAAGSRASRSFQLYAKKPGHVNDFKALEPLLVKAGAMRMDTADEVPYLTVDLQLAHVVIEQDILQNKGRSIVQFSWKWLLRDLLKPVLKREGPSRSALMTPPDAAGTH